MLMVERRNVVVTDGEIPYPVDSPLTPMTLGDYVALDDAEDGTPDYRTWLSKRRTS